MTRPLIRYFPGDPSKAWRPRCLRVGRVVVPLDADPLRTAKAACLLGGALVAGMRLLSFVVF